MRRLSVPVVCVVLLLGANVYAAETGADAIVGRWFTEGKSAVVEVYSSGDLYCGKIVWIEEPNNSDGTEKTDLNNLDESKRDRKILDMNMVSDFKYKGRNKWGNGKIYDPDSGKTYSCKAKLDGDKLSIRGFIGISLIGRTTVWTREQ